MSQDHSSTEKAPGFWYTYFGVGGASAFAFLWALSALIWIFSVLNWG